MADGIKSSDVFARDGALDKAMKVWATRIWAVDDSRSVIRLAPEVIQRRMAEIPDDIRKMSEGELKKRIKPTPTDNQIRISFWLEYDRVQSRMLPQMETTMIIRGILSEDHFYDPYLKNYDRLAWVLIPPKSYTVKLSEMLETGLEQLRESLEIPHIENGKVNTKLLELKLKITAMMDLRMNGAIAQKVQIEQKNMNMNLAIRGSSADVSDLLESKNMEEIDKKLNSLRKKDLMLSKGIHPDQEEIVVDSEIVKPIEEPASDDSAEKP